MRRQARLAVAVLMVVVGGLWCIQGLGWLGGSAMTGHVVWAIVGGAVVLGGIVAGVTSLRGEDTPPGWAADPAEQPPATAPREEPGP